MTAFLLACSCWGAPAAAADSDAVGSGDLFMPFGEQARDVLRAERGVRVRDMTATALVAPQELRERRRRPRLDLSPALDEIFAFLHRHGVPLQEQRDEKGQGPVGVYADFNVGRDLPALSFHLGDRPIEPLGAFYSPDHGFRCALVWPIDRFTLRIEGGEDSEFGYFGIAGLQWLHPKRPLALGIGVPINLRDAEGEIGFIVQMRMILE